MGKSASFVHKSPAIWSKNKFITSIVNINTLEDLKSSLFQINHSSVFEEMIKEDIYVNAFIELAKKQNIKDINIIQGHTESEKANWNRELQTGYFKLDDEITFWSIDDINHITPFFSSDLLMTRGQYPKLHSAMKKIRPKMKGCWLHYPATSILYPHMEKVFLEWKNQFHSKDKSMKIQKKVIKFLSKRRNPIWKDLKNIKINQIKNETFDLLIKYALMERLEWSSNSYDILLMDDRESLDSRKELFPNTLILPFIKPHPKSHFSKSNFEKDIDIVFAGSTLGPTKNHKLFTEIIMHIDNLYDGDELSIHVIGDEGSLPWFSNFLASKFKKIKITNLGTISRDDTMILFSKSRYCFITSGRDCNPRLIAEANISGCKIICLNLLSDGYSIIDKFFPLGKVINIPFLDWNFDELGSPNSSNSIKIAMKVIDEINNPVTPFLTKKLALELYSNKKLVSHLSDNIDLLS